MKAATFGRLFAALAVLTCVLALAACGGGGGSSSSEESGSTAGTEASTAEAGLKQVPAATIGLVDLLAEGSFQQRIDTTLTEAAEHVGWSVKLTDAEGSPEKSNAGVQNFVNQGVDAIVLNSIEPSTVRSGLVAAEAAGIPVIAIGGESHHELDSLLAGVYTESEAKLSAPLADLIGEEEPAGSEIAIFRSDLFLSGIVRAETVEKIAEEKGLEVVANEDVGFDVAEAQKKAADILTAHPDLKAFVPVFDVWTAPVVAAIKQAGKSDQVGVYSFYADLQNVPLMRANKNVIALADGNQAVGAAFAVEELLKNLVEGEEIAKTAPAGLFKYKAVTRDEIPPEGQDGPYSVEEILAPYFTRWDAAFAPAP